MLQGRLLQGYYLHLVETSLRSEAGPHLAPAGLLFAAEVRAMVLLQWSVLLQQGASLLVAQVPLLLHSLLPVLMRPVRVLLPEELIQ